VAAVNGRKRVLAVKQKEGGIQSKQGKKVRRAAEEVEEVSQGDKLKGNVR